MPFYGKCGFCGGNGHNIKMCCHPNKPAILNDLKSSLGNLSSKRDIVNYIDRLNRTHMELLANDINVSCGVPKNIMRKYIINYYVCELEKRKIRWRTYIDELEENDSRNVQPHSLFRRCLETISYLGARVYRLATGQRIHREVPYIPLNVRDPHMWQIIPSLELAEKAQKVECPICLEFKPILNIITPKCNCKHSICKGCFCDYVDKHSKMSPKCPLCRSVITSVSVYDVYTYNEYVDKYTNV